MSWKDRIVRVGIKSSYRANKGRPETRIAGRSVSTDPLPTTTGMQRGITNRPARLLLPPGIGDIHWVLLRLRGLLRANECDAHIPIVHVCSGDPVYDRAHDFLAMVPWVRFGGYFDIRPRVYRKATNGAFFDGKIYAPWEGFDLFLSVNKFIEQGWELDKILPEAGSTDWHYPLILPEPSEEPCPPFLLATFYNASFYADWWKASNPAKLLKAVGDQLDDRDLPHEIRLVGAKWDLEVSKSLEGAHPRVRNLVGQTTLKELFQWKQRAAGFFGHPSGSGMLAQHIGCPTVLFWGPWWQFTKGMYTNWARPNMLEHGFYRALSIETAPDDAARTILEVAGF